MTRYVNARAVLPDSLVREIQKYVDGQHLYIPKTERADWGSVTGVRDELRAQSEDCRAVLWWDPPTRTR